MSDAPRHWPGLKDLAKGGISEATYYNWRKRHGGLMRSEVKRLKQLDDENQRLMKMVGACSSQWYNASMARTRQGSMMIAIQNAVWLVFIGSFVGLFLRAMKTKYSEFQKAPILWFLRQRDPPLWFLAGGFIFSALILIVSA